MGMVAEVLGFSLPFSSTIPAGTTAQLRNAKRAGIKIMESVRNELTPSKFLDQKSFTNAIRFINTVSGSLNAPMHLFAIMNEAGLKIDLDAFTRISLETPTLCPLMPSSPITIPDLDRVGGVPAVLKALGNLIHRDCMTTNGIDIGEIIDQAEVHDSEIIRSIKDPVSQTGSIVVLKGSLAPEGAIVKKSAVVEKMWHHKGPAKVFDSEEEAIKSIYGNTIQAGNVIVIRYEGPRGGPGMREMLAATSAVVGMGLDDKVALITDGRFSGNSSGPAIGYIGPEAMLGGPIAIIQEGDEIEIDIVKGKLELLLNDHEIMRQISEWKPPEPKVTKGYLSRYARMVSPALCGAVLK
jgi:dihydroxy-acid dehydratase